MFKLKIIVFFCALALSLAFFGFFTKEDASVLQLRTELQGFILSEVATDGELTEKEELRLQRYALQARVNPLFALPGTDIAKLHASIAELKISEEEIDVVLSKLYGNFDTKSFYPVSFLENIAKVELQRRELIVDPTRKRAEQYNQLQHETVDSAIRYIDSFLEALALIDEVERFETIVLNGGSVSTSYFQQVLRSYRDVLRIQKERVDERWQCFEGVDDQCEKIALVSTLNTMYDDSISGVLPEAVQSNYGYLDIYRNSVFKGEYRPVRIAVLSRSYCQESFDPAYYFLWWREHTDGSYIFRPDFLNEIFFWDMYAEEVFADAFHLAYQENKGGQYLQQSLLQSYGCFDLGREFASLMRIMYTFDFLSDFNTSMHDEYIQVIPEFETLQKLITDDSIVTELEVGQFVGLLQQLFTDYTEIELVHIIGKDVVLDLQEFLLTYTLGTYKYSEIVMSVVSNNSVVHEYEFYGQTHTPYSLLYVRTAPQLLLGGFNQSIVPADILMTEQPMYELPIELVSMDKLRNTFNQDKIIEISQGALKVEIDLGQKAGHFYIVK